MTKKKTLRHRGVVASDSISEIIQVEKQKRKYPYIQINNSTFEIDSLQYKKNNLKTINSTGLIINLDMMLINVVDHLLLMMCIWLKEEHK